MESPYDNENYWNRSTSKAFSFDDDDESEIAAIGAARGGIENILNDDTYSEASFDDTLEPGSALNLSIKTVISEKALKVILQEQSMDDRIIPKGVSPEEELKLLRRQIQTTLYNPSPEAIAYKMLLGKNVQLEVFKSLHEKEDLLDAVLRNGGGDAVIGVLLFLKKSLNRQNFYKVLQQRPKALQHYKSYVKQRQSQGAIELLQLFGKQPEAALLQFKLATACNDLQMRKQRLRQLLDHYRSDMGVVSIYQQIFLATLQLLKFIEAERSSLGVGVHMDSTPIEVLYALLRKHNNWKEQDLESANSAGPLVFCSEQHISAAQFDWTALNERAKAQAYADLEIIFKRSTIWSALRQKQFHINVPLELAIVRLNELQAPVTVLYLFLSKMSNTSEKLELARRVKCTKAEIDALAGMKDVVQLMQLKDKLPDRSEEQFHCEKALTGLQNKRWTTDSIKLKF